MNIWLLMVTFLAVNLDFFVLLLFLLKKFSVRQVVVGYLSGVVSVSYTHLTLPTT